jgi:hypothetical protein
MSATLNGLSTVIAALDAVQPWTQQTAGEGAADHVRQVEDVVALDATGLGSIGSYYRLARIPANAKVKRVEVFTDVAADTNAASTLHLEFGVVFSDSTVDGTPIAYQGQFPAAAANGTVVGSSGSRNALFGNVAQGNNTPIPITEITFKGTVASLLNLTQKGLAKIFGFVTAQGYDQPCPGWMDIYAYVATAAATPQAANLYARVQYTK